MGDNVARIDDPEVMVLNKEPVVWTLLRGTSPMCGNVECYIKSDYIAPQGAFIVSPNALPFKPGDDAGDQTLFYRTTVMLPEPMLTSNEPLNFHISRLYSSRHQLYINGIELENNANDFVMTTIPVAAIRRDKTIDIVLRLETKNVSMPGIARYATILIGPTSKNNAMLIRHRVSSENMHSWKILPRLVASFIFGFLFLSMSAFPQYMYLFFYGAFGAVSLFFVGPASMNALSHYVDCYSLYIQFRFLSVICMVAFIHSLFRRKSNLFNWMMAGAVGCGLAMAFVNNLGVSAALQNYYLYDCIETIRICGMVYGVYLSVEACLVLRKIKKARSRFYIASFLALFFFVSIPVVLFSDQIFKMHDLGREIFEMLSFIFFSSMVALELGRVAKIRDRLSQKFSAVRDSRVVDRLLASDGHEPLEEDAAILFIDIRSFSEICNRSTPADVVELLNDYFEIIADTIQTHDGIVDKFIGDGAFAIWSLQYSNKNPSIMAITAAIKLRRRFSELNAKREDSGKMPFAIGIGLHQGKTILGKIGSDERYDYTYIGDAVNLASRIEGLTKSVKCDILISQEFADAVSTDFVLQPCGDFLVKGYDTPITVFKVIGFVAEDGYILAYDRAIDGKNYTPENLPCDLSLDAWKVVSYAKNPREEITEVSAA